MNSSSSSVSVAADSSAAGVAGHLRPFNLIERIRRIAFPGALGCRLGGHLRPFNLVEPLRWLSWQVWEVVEGLCRCRRLGGGFAGHRRAAPMPPAGGGFQGIEAGHAAGGPASRPSSDCAHSSHWAAARPNSSSAASAGELEVAAANGPGGTGSSWGDVQVRGAAVT